ncbi:proline-rich protein [Russula emetica]|nr:proline-rich protein [Russula emetica]
MVHFSTLLFAFSVAGSVTAVPTQLNKRIAQDIPDSTTKWQAACVAANGGAQCNQIAVTAFGTLLAGAGDCDQQNNADIMMDLSKKLNSNQMISLAQIFCQQPRNSPNSLSIPYCQEKPQNAELNGLFQCQFQGVNPTKFANGNTVGGAGTIPLGQSGPLNPPGSCPANTAGPIPAGQQLTDLVNSPGVPGGSAGNGTTQNSSSASSSASVSATQAAPSSAASATNTTSPPTPRAATNSSASGSGFKAQNGKDAQALNQKFSSLTADSACTDGEQACVNGQFAQCSGGKFALTPCANGLTCTALPLVNKPGTSVTCDTQADSAARIAQALGSNRK